MFARYPNIKRSLIVTMVCCLLGEVLPLRAQGQAIEAKPPEQPTGLTIEVTSPTEGADFSTYLTHLTPVVKRNWYIAMPEPVLMGQKGLVIVRVQVLRDGTLLNHTPTLVRTSGKEPLDKAALDAIRSSLPFENLPTAFPGPNAELRFTFFYNLPPAPKQRSAPIGPEIFKKPGLVDVYLKTRW
jgi:TonB family protein